MKSKKGRRWVHKDGIPVLYSPAYPGGLTFALIQTPPDCPIELRARIRRLREELKEKRRAARVTFHELKVCERRLREVIDELARKAVLAAGEEKPTL